MTPHPPDMDIHTGEILAISSTLSCAEFGALMLLRMALWTSPTGYLPDDDVALARVCKMQARQWRNTRASLIPAYFTVTEDRRIYDPALLQERIRATARASRLHVIGKKGGRRS